jgi:hypothetical protein
MENLEKGFLGGFLRSFGEFWGIWHLMFEED